ncbi:MAG: hypothetical protein Q8L57_00325 [bacterium]|nr:hypothetical protein [bacterium]
MKDKYGVDRAYYFIGLIPKEKDMDGDYAGLVKFLQEKNKLKIILSPGIQKRCSILLKRTNAPITYLNDVKNKISLNNKEKAPIKDEP